MNTKYLTGLMAGAAMMISASAVTAAGIEPAQYTDGVVTAIDHAAKTVAVAGKVYEVIGTMPDLRVGERADVTFLKGDGAAAPQAWFKSKDRNEAPGFVS